MLDFLGEKLFLRQSANNFRWVDFPLTNSGEFYKTRVIKLQEMKLKKKKKKKQQQGKSASVYLC